MAAGNYPVSPDTLVIEPATVADYAAILDLQRLAFRTEAELYDDWSLPPLVQTFEELQREFATSLVLKATLDGQLVGSVRARQEQATWCIGRLIVHPEVRCQGIGTALMRAIEARCASAARFELFTGSRSTGNIRLYSRLGYQVRRRQQAGPKVALVFMDKTVGHSG
jgi:predicted N-acetyltransferase YhbS